MSSPQPSRTKRALLIGIDRYPKLGRQFQLSGCVNDAQLIGGIIKDYFDFPSANITFLFNEQATRRNILEALSQLSDNASDNDTVLIYFSGHGAQLRSGVNPEEEWESTIVPCDSGRDSHANLDIRAFETHPIIFKIAEKANHSVLIMDSSFAGRFLMIPGNAPVGQKQMSTALQEKLVFMSSDDGYSYMLEVENTGIHHGAFTYFLAKELINSAPSDTYRTVFERTIPSITARFPDQRPRIIGAHELTALDGKSQARRPIVVINRANDLITIGGGAAHGITLGSEIAIYPMSKKAQKDELTPIGLARIISVDALTSSGSIIAESGSEQIAEGSQILYTEHQFNTRAPVLAVWASGPPIFDSNIEALSKLMGRSHLLKETKNPQLSDIHVHIVSKGTASEDPADYEWVATETSEPTAELLPRHPANQALSLHKLTEGLERISKYRQILSIRNNISPMHGKISISLLKYKGGQWTTAEPDRASGHIEYEEGESLAIRVVNSHSEPVYIYILDLGLTWRIEQIYPFPGVNEPLQPGGSLLVGADPHEQLQLSIPADYRGSAQGGIETLKLFALTETEEFLPLINPGLRNVGRTHDIVTQLLKGTWTTVERSFLLLPRATN